MNYNPLINEIDGLISYLENDDWLIQTLDSIIYVDENMDKQHLELENFVKKVLGSETTFFSKNLKLKEVSNDVYKNLVTVRSKLRTISVKKLFLKLSRLETFLMTIIEHSSGEAVAIQSVLAEVSRFSLTYETYLESQSDIATIRVFSVAVDLDANIKLLKNLLKLVCHSLKTEQARYYPEQALSLPVEESVAQERLIHRLNAIQSLYKTFCQLFDISAKDDPVHVFNHVQDNELTLKVVGNVRVLDLMSYLIKSMDSLPNTLSVLNEHSPARELETLVEFFHLSEQLEKYGLEVRDKKRAIQKVAVEAVKQLLLLQEDMVTERINNQMRLTPVDAKR